MGMLRTALVVGAVVVVAQSPHLLGDARDAVAHAVTPSAPTSTQDQQAYDRICPLFGVWVGMDADGRAATTKTLKALARQRATQTEDPAVKAFLRVVPDALGDGSSVQTRAARALVARECRAHDN